MVLRFDPPAGTELRRDEVVTVVVSEGHEPVAVPDVTGQTPEQAQTNLEDLGFTVERTDDGRSADVATGEVMAVAPGPGDGPQAYGSTLTIQVSAGLPQVTVPDVTGKKRGRGDRDPRGRRPRGGRHVVLREQGPQPGARGRRGRRAGARRSRSW